MIKTLRLLLYFYDEDSNFEIEQMNRFIKILYSLFYFKLPRFILDKIMSENDNTLEIIAKKGHYKDRFFLVEKIKSLEFENQLKLLPILLDDKIRIVSKSIINQYKNIDLSNELNLLIEEKETYWEYTEAESKIKFQKTSQLLKNSKNYKRKFGNGESFQIAKQMLKKPMNTGK